MADKPYELVLFGASGYTGKLIAEHLTRNAPTDLRWAVAGRNANKLEKLVGELKTISSDRVKPGKTLGDIANYGF